jgi:hypothetical protein
VTLEHKLGGFIPDGLRALHRCGNRLCYNPDHLYAGTDKDNARDRERHGMTARGSRSGQAKLTEEQVQEIRYRYEQGEAGLNLALAFSVSPSTISQVVLRKTWRHVA